MNVPPEVTKPNNSKLESTKQGGQQTSEPSTVAQREKKKGPKMPNECSKTNICECLIW